jgi:5-methylcytosine-specific restriction enzyme A
MLVPKGRCATHAVTREHQRHNYDIRRWYRTARWRTLRAQVLDENPLCVECTTPTIATAVDHIRRHQGNAALFFDRSNLQGLCARHHGAKTGSGE